MAPQGAVRQTAERVVALFHGWSRRSRNNQTDITNGRMYSKSSNKPGVNDYDTSICRLGCWLFPQFLSVLFFCFVTLGSYEKAQRRTGYLNTKECGTIS